MRMYQNQASKIYGFNGPFFPAAVDVLNGHFLRVADSLSHTLRLCRALGKITGTPPTSDEYAWGWGLESAGTRILIPDFGNPDIWDGRSIAVYDNTQRNLAAISMGLELPMEIVNSIASRVAIAQG